MTLKINNPKISLIVPVYNVEAYLRRALDSVVSQTFKDIEVILVNDGSTDSSYDILQEYSKKYDNFIILNKENGGLSDARNAGLKMAKGEYIAFLDSDDYLHPKFLEILYNLAIDNNADISCCNFKMYFPKINLKISIPTVPVSKVYSKEKALKKLILDYTIHHFSWNKLCKKAIFEDNNITFPNMYFEDISTSPRLFYNANKIAITTKSLYYYTQRPGSILKTMNAKKINDYIKTLGIIRNYLEAKNDYKSYEFAFNLCAIKLKLVTYYYLFELHLRYKNLSGIISNIKSSNKLIKYFKGDYYKYGAKSETVKMPYLVIDPKKQLRKQPMNNE